MKTMKCKENSCMSRPVIPHFNNGEARKFATFCALCVWGTYPVNKTFVEWN